MKINIRIRSVFFCLSLVGLSTFSQAADCGSPSWVSETYVDNILNVSIKVQCAFTPAAPVNFETLMNFYLQEATKGIEIQEVYQGPVEREYKNLPGYYIDSRQKTRDSNGELNIRFDRLLGSDLDTQLFYEMTSTKVEGTGNAKYTKYSGSLYEIVAQGEKIAATFTLESRIQKPDFAPKGIFVSMAKDGVVKSLLARSATEVANIKKAAQ